MMKPRGKKKKKKKKNVCKFRKKKKKKKTRLLIEIFLDFFVDFFFKKNLIGSILPARCALAPAKNFDESLLGHLDAAEHFHAFLALALARKEFLLAGDVATVALGRHLRPERRDPLARDGLVPGNGLDHDLKHRPRNRCAQPLAQDPPEPRGRGSAWSVE
jgi:hypothetical protein